MDHALFDGFAWFTTTLLVVLIRKYFADAFPSSAGRRARVYLAALVIGAGIGAFGLGTANLWLAGHVGAARWIEGALAGAIIAVGLYEWRRGMTGRTAALFALPIALAPWLQHRRQYACWHGRYRPKRRPHRQELA